MRMSDVKIVTRDLLSNGMLTNLYRNGKRQFAVMLGYGIQYIKVPNGMRLGNEREVACL